MPGEGVNSRSLLRGNAGDPRGPGCSRGPGYPAITKPHLAYRYILLTCVVCIFLQAKPVLKSWQILLKNQVSGFHSKIGILNTSITF